MAQDRERVILFGIKSDLVDQVRKNAQLKLKNNFNWGIKQDCDQQHRSQCEWPETNNFVENSVIAQPVKIIPELCIEYWFQKNDVYNHYNSDDYFLPKSMDRFITIPEGDVSKKSFKRLHRWRYSPTAAYGNNEVHLHPYHARRISVAEALAIQSLPKEYVLNKSLSKSDMFKTIGNGVPYLLARGIACSIRQFCENDLRRGDNNDIFIERNTK